MIFSSKKSKPVEKSLAVPMGKPIKPESKISLFFKKIRTFINNKSYSIRMQANIISAEYQVRDKFIFLLTLIINILVTGLIIWYCVEYRNILSYGLMAIMITYYFEKIVEIIKKPYTETKK
jgi:hypothetical protein